MNKYTTNTTRSYSDVLLIPFFIVLIYYFKNITHPTNLEKILLLGSIIGVLFSLYWVYVAMNDCNDCGDCNDDRGTHTTPMSTGSVVGGDDPGTRVCSCQCCTK